MWWGVDGFLRFSHFIDPLAAGDSRGLTNGISFENRLSAIVVREAKYEKYSANQSTQDRSTESRRRGA